MRLVWLLEPGDIVQPGDQIAVDETGGAINLKFDRAAPGLIHDSVADHYIVIRKAGAGETESQET